MCDWRSLHVVRGLMCVVGRRVLFVVGLLLVDVFVRCPLCVVGCMSLCVV